MSSEREFMDESADTRAEYNDVRVLPVVTLVRP